MTAKCFHEQFEALLPKIKESARFAFRGLNPSDRQEAIADVCAAAWSAWHGLIRKSKDPLAVGVTGIANNAIRYVKSGRKLGNLSSGRGARDVWHPRARRALGLRVVSFEELAGPAPRSWQDWLVADHRVGPADAAAFRVDFAEWLAGLSEKKRRVAESLALGEEGVVVARLVGIAQSRVTQLRHELEASWRAFQGVATPVATVPV
jgi:hypothetical protein